MAQAIISGLANGGIYALLAVGIVLVYKGSRVLNFAQGELGTLGLFITWGLTEVVGWPWFAGAAVAVAAVVLVSLIFERLVVRGMANAPRVSVAVATIGLLLFLIAFEFKVWGPSPQILPPPIEGLGIQIANFYVSPTQLLALAVAAVMGAALAAFLTKTDFGLGVLAASQDATATRLVGVRINRVSAFTWGIAGAISVVAAVLIEPTIGIFAPGFMTGLFVRALAAALLGGLTSLPGAFAGGLAVGVIEAVVGKQFVQSTFPGIQSVAVLIVIVVILLVRPQGMFGKAVA